jgi:outer membrane cobalamin receptor
MKKTPLALAVSIALANGSLIFSTPVLAQEEDAASDVIDEVIATGSRIRKDVFTSSAPMDVVDVEQASVLGIGSVGDLLRRNSAVAGSPQVTPATTAEYLENGGLGTKTLSLRGLGANRTLVLINGRRPGPAGVRGAVSSFDLNILPLATIERVEIRLVDLRFGRRGRRGEYHYPQGRWRNDRRFRLATERGWRRRVAFERDVGQELRPWQLPLYGQLP